MPLLLRTLPASSPSGSIQPVRAQTQENGGETPSARRQRAGNDSLRNVRATLLLLAGCYTVVVAGSFLGSRRDIAGEHRQMALLTARSFFDVVVMTRRWNALHGGVYVPVTAETQPNEWLEDPRRDLVTADGQRLTKINPAYMTRMISQIQGKAEGVNLHITSLKPLRPLNAPDEWERASLEAFERGEKERSEIGGSGNDRVFRYMAPLVTEASCLRCHARQGYRSGDIRGGIAVSLPYGPYDTSRLRQVQRSLASHALLLAIGLGFMAFIGQRLLGSIRRGHESLQEVRILEGLLPICSVCKRIRREDADPHDQTSWRALEAVISEDSEAEFSHGLCPECAHAHYGRYYKPPARE